VGSESRWPTVEFIELTSWNARAISALLDAVMLDFPGELRFRFSVLNEFCTEGDSDCIGRLCSLFRAKLPSFAACLVELPWNLTGRVSSNWCFSKDHEMPTTWRLRGDPAASSGNFRAAALFGPDQIHHLVLQDIDFKICQDGQALSMLSKFHMQRGVETVVFVNCTFPEAKNWPRHFGPYYHSMFDCVSRVFLRGCNLSAEVFKDLCPNANVQ
jgi:hypothetical protein